MHKETVLIKEISKTHQNHQYLWVIQAIKKNQLELIGIST